MRRRILGWVLKLAAVSVLCLALIRQFADVDFAGVIVLLERVGWKALLVLIPAGLSMLADTAGWAVCIIPGSPVRLIGKILPLRIGCDALTSSLPAGAAAAETARPILLHRRCAVEMPDAIASCLLAKLNMAIAQILFVLCVLVFALQGRTGSIDPTAGAAWRLGLGALVLVPILAGMFLLYSGPRLTQIGRLLGRLPAIKLQNLLGRLEPNLRRIDHYAHAFAVDHTRRLVLSLVAFVAGWFLCASESFVILALLGAGASLSQALTMEVVASLLRIAFFFIPSALGAAEIGYATLIASFGVADPLVVTTAFIAIKRSRELLWITLGFGALGLSFWRPGRLPN